MWHLWPWCKELTGGAHSAREGKQLSGAAKEYPGNNIMSFCNKGQILELNMLIQEILPLTGELKPRVQMRFPKKKYKAGSEHNQQLKLG